MVLVLDDGCVSARTRTTVIEYEYDCDRAFEYEFEFDCDRAFEHEYEHGHEDEIGAGERELGVRDRATSTNPTASF